MTKLTGLVSLSLYPDPDPELFHMHPDCTIFLSLLQYNVKQILTDFAVHCTVQYVTDDASAKLHGT